MTKSTGKRLVSRHGATVKERLMLHTDKGSGPCWLWTGAKDIRGYGKINIAGRYMQAHRVAWAEYVGSPGALFVCHRCDTPACINPDHLFLGTHQDNMNDKVSKGRQSKGVDRPEVKLNDEIVRRIRRGDKSCRSWSRETGASPMAIWNARTGKTWKHIKETQ